MMYLNQRETKIVPFTQLNNKKNYLVSSSLLQTYPTMNLNLTQFNGNELGISDDIKFSTNITVFKQ